MAPSSICRDEAWKPVVGYEGFYAVSNKGRVESLERVILIEHPIAGVVRHRLRGRLLRPSRDPRTRHMRVTLSRESNLKVCSIPRLVLEAFVGPCPAGHQATSLNDDPSDCHLANLEWRPIPLIVRHAIDRGARQVCDRHYKAKLSTVDVQVIRSSAHQSSRALAARYGVNKNTVAAIRRGKSWKSLAFEPPPTPPASPGPDA